MIAHKAAIIVRRPAADIFRFIAVDYFANHPKWAPQVVSVRPRSPGPVSVGTRGEVVRRLGGRDLTYDFEVTDYVTNEVIAVKAGGPMPFTAVYSVRSLSEKESELKIEFKLKMRGLPRLMEPFMAGGIRREVAAVGSRIKSMLEA